MPSVHPQSTTSTASFVENSLFEKNYIYDIPIVIFIEGVKFSFHNTLHENNFD